MRRRLLDSVSRSYPVCTVHTLHARPAIAAFIVYQILNPQFHFFALRINFTLS
jgi:hypothetical protein